MDIKNTSITRKLDETLNELQDNFAELYEVEDFESAIIDLEMSVGKSDYPSKLKKLFRMFDASGIEYDKDGSFEYYKSLVSSAEIQQIVKIQDRFVEALYSCYENYPTPEDYMKRLVRRLSSEDDHWENDTLRLRILKQFIKYGDCLAGAGCGGKAYITRYAVHNGAAGRDVEEVISHVDDAVFGPLETATREQKRFGGIYGLLKIADDLATGKFRMEGATKKSLYLFAMVYGMTYYLGPEQENVVFDPRTDIEKNLFRDYYSNNFARFVTDAYRDRLQEYEIDPSGQGINYKNYAEMVYLYYISRDIPVLEKIKKSNDMIETIKREMRGKGAPKTEEKSSGQSDPAVSKTGKSKVYSEKILNKTEEEFKDYLCKNYLCDTQQGNTIVSPLQLETDQDRAYHEYSMIVDLITELGINLENCNYGLWFVDVAAFYKKGYEEQFYKDLQMDKTRFAEFMELLLAVNNYVGYTAQEEASDLGLSREHKEPSTAKTSALFVSSAKEVTRSSLITAFYYYYNALRFRSGTDKRMNFREVFNDFKNEVDFFLEEAGYQLFGGKDLFDVLIAFSSYAYLNL